MSTSPLVRPRDVDAIRGELREIRVRLGVPLVFGGEVTAGTLLISELLGARTPGLRNLHVPAGSGLGGRVVAERRPDLVADYASARTITHQFDQPVLAEGIRSIVATPVIVGGVARAVLYAAVRDQHPLGNHAVDVVIQAGRRLTNELTVRDEVDRRVRLLDNAQVRQPSGAAADREELRAVYAELRDAAGAVNDPDLRARLRSLSNRLGAISGGSSGVAVSLSVRETDVLAQIALGCTNAETARRLALRPETVKSYLRNAMRKLGAHTRHEAVVLARRHGLLP
ncbi:helix-turn-helix transcriptional regulator [Parafrankia soli]|uniref:Helix-turn-helix transcriptional regulator n=1 Tax=Parafrankia soli TaxID=2599596 RepID=A0A1S1RGE0_9ACTN|nr:LuxR C-terminal-related transcriptional regulator [Parafrankia soli]OHV44322.1 helix-turn-helix transcriptional regulator [Parafrankia soli]